MGDGINDAAALRAADVGISVDNAVDIAKESADIILLEKSLMILEEGVVEGRKVFGNIIKYIKMGASSQFWKCVQPARGKLSSAFSSDASGAAPDAKPALRSFPDGDSIRSVDAEYLEGPGAGKSAIRQIHGLHRPHQLAL